MLSCPELLSPAGSLEALKYAVMYGADAVYCALPRFGMRAAPVNLTIGGLHFCPCSRQKSISDPE